MSLIALIVDDDEFIRSTLKRVLERDRLLARHDIQVLEAADGREGLKKFEEHKPHLVIVDLLMPKTDGFTVIREIRESEHGKDIPIAVTSGVYKDAAIADELEQKYHTHMFAKPYELKHIAEFVSNALSDSTRPTRPSNAPPLSAAEGDLRERSVAAVFLDLLDSQATGRLVLKRGRVVRQIDLYAGHPIRVATNVREETLGHFLAERRIISQEVHRAALALAARERIRIGEALTSLGQLTAEELLQRLTEQTRYKLTQALRWPDGQWSFTETAPQGNVGNALNIAEVVVHGLMRSAQFDPPNPAIAALRSAPLYLNERGARLLPLLGSAVSSTFKKVYQDGLTVEALEAAGVAPLGLYTCLDILHNCAGLSEAHQPSVPGLLADDSPGPVDLNLLFDTQSRPAPDADLYSFLFSGGGGTNAGERAAPILPEEMEDEEEELVAENSESPVSSHEGVPAPDPAAAPLLTLDDSPSAGQDTPIVDVQFKSIPRNDELIEARNAILEEYLRVQDKNHYQVLGLADTVGPEAVKLAYEELKERFSVDKFGGLDLGRDFQKLDQLHAAYDNARATLLDDDGREAYDDHLEQVEEFSFDVPSMHAEIEFRNGHEHFANDRHDEALESISRAIQAAPQEAAYHAFYAWVLFAKKGTDEAAAVEAEPHLDKALELDPDERSANEFKGLMLAHLRRDTDIALDHLEKVIVANVNRSTALDAFQKLLLGKGDYDRLDRRLRKLILRNPEESPDVIGNLWYRLGHLHKKYTGDHDAALLALQVALKLLPGDEKTSEELASLQSSAPDLDRKKLDELAAQWQQDRKQLSPLSEHFKLACEMGLHDVAFCNASVQEALALGDNQATAFYRRYRPAFVVRALRPIDAEMWSKLLAPGDHVLVGALFSLLGPIIEEIWPGDDARREIEEARPLDEGDMSESLQRVRSYVAHMLAIEEPRVLVRDDYARQVHLATCGEHVLLVGQELLADADKFELSFRVARAMSYAVAYRSVAASRPTRVLKTALLACYAIRAPEAKLPDPSGLLPRIKRRLLTEDAAVLNQACDLVAQISQHHPVLNLSQWSKQLGLTANRLGLLLSGDLPAALRYAELSSESDGWAELLDFGLGPVYPALRRQLGLSVDI